MAPTETAPEAVETAPGGARQTLATRIAERNRLRALRAERLARLHPGAPETVAETVAEAAPARAPDRAPASDAAQDALEHFLRALTGGLAAAPQAPPPEAAAVLHFQRPEPAAAAACDLARLPGAGPDLVWALQRAGICRLADLAPLAAEDLAARLGPLGRLVPTETWIAVAQAAGQER